MAKQLTIIFWCLVYGEVLGYINASLTGIPFDPVSSAIFPTIVGWVLINVISLFLAKPHANSKENKK